VKSFLTGADNLAKAGMVPDSLVGLEISYILVWQIGCNVVE